MHKTNSSQFPRNKMSPRIWAKNSGSATNLNGKPRKKRRWDLLKVENTEFEDFWNDRFYDYCLPIPPKLKDKECKYLYLRFVGTSQLFEIYCTKSRHFLTRRAGPEPGQKNFKPLWEVFLHEFEPRKKKRVIVHPEDKKMSEYLQNYDTAKLIKKGSDYEYSKWSVS